MIRIVLSFFAATLLTLGLGPSAAKAQARVFVAAQGSDSNPCSFALPCRTFQHAHDTVAANGEIDVLDPAGYGAVTITKSISIQGHGFSGISVASGTAITINAGASDKINLRGLLLDGVGTGAIGIKHMAGGVLSIEGSLIRGFTSWGVDFAPNASSKLYIADTLVSENGDTGVYFIPSGAGTVTGVLDRVESNNNGGAGFAVDGNSSSATINVTLADSVSSHNTGDGISYNAATVAGAVMVRSTTIASNGGNGVNVIGAAAKLRIARSMITGNAIGFATSSSGTLVSYSDNSLDSNATNGVATSTIGPL
jgi:hypothetical protein